MNKTVDSRLFEMYRRKKIGRNTVCRSCRADCRKKCLPFYGPLSFWRVGREYQHDPYRLLVVGKTGRRTAGIKRKTGIWDVRKTADELFDESWPFWSYMREILERVYGEATTGWNRIALTNLVKCNNSGDVDTTSSVMRANCLDKLQVFQAEIKLLNPKLMVFYTGRDYDKQIERLCFGDYGFDHEYRFARNGNKKMRWWVREFTLDGKPVLKFLRTSHPERQDRAGFVKRVAEWVKEAAF